MKINTLIKNTSKPELFTPGTAIMWNDEYISKQLLDVHLNKELNLASRKPEVIDQTLQWILSHRKGKSNLSILDLGCGPGLYAQRLAAMGHSVTGVDFSNNSLKYAREQAEDQNLSIEYKQQNYLELDLGEKKFDLVMMIYCDFGVLLPREQNTLLSHISRYLKDDGLFVFDVLNTKDFDKKASPDSWECTEKGFWKDSPYLSLSRSHVFEEDKVILSQHTVLGENDNLKVYRFWTQFFSHEKLSAILKQNGFQVQSFHEDVIPLEDMWTGDNVTFTVARKKN